MNSVAILSIVALLMVHSTSVLTHHRTQRCLPPRLVHVHIPQMLGFWRQYVYQIVNNSAVLFSCESFNVTLQNETYIGVIQLPGTPDLTFEITELPGPFFYHVGTPDPSLQFIDQITTYTSEGTKISISNVFQSGNFSASYVLLASTREYLDTSLHESFLHSVGFHRNPNSDVIPASQCPQLATNNN